jgi:stage II sporulation protein R
MKMLSSSIGRVYTAAYGGTITNDSNEAGRTRSEYFLTAQSFDAFPNDCANPLKGSSEVNTEVVKMKRLSEKRILLISIITGLLAAICITAASTYSYAKEQQAGIAGNVMRFHVLANSDSDDDQNLKLLVRDNILDKFQPGLASSESLNDTREYLSANINEITACAEAVIKEQGYDYPVRAAVETSFFPTIEYGSVTFPTGEYEALRVVIGEGQGRNWWCVMFPPLCFVDLTQPIPNREMQQLSEAIPEEGFRLLTYQEQDDSVKVRFKIVEWWLSLFGGDNEMKDAVAKK